MTILLQLWVVVVMMVSRTKENVKIMTTIALAALLQASALAAPEVQAQTAAADPAALEAEQLAKGKTANAITALEKHVAAAPEDPGLLINLGIAHAQAGDEDKARTLFQRALVSSKPTELETADGESIDSRRLARKAMCMLDRGDFTTRLSRRD